MPTIADEHEHSRQKIATWLRAPKKLFLSAARKDVSTVHKYKKKIWQIFLQLRKNFVIFLPQKIQVEKLESY